jgi:hypothetical protein
MSKLSRTIMLAVGLAALPTTAAAVSVSANDGSGSQSFVSYRTVQGPNGTTIKSGANVTGTLKSTAGKTVYYSGKVAWGNGCFDPDTGRYSSNTSSLTAVTRGGAIDKAPLNGCPYQGVKSRVCTVRNNFPDACGSDSSTYGS